MDAGDKYLLKWTSNVRGIIVLAKFIKYSDDTLADDFIHYLETDEITPALEESGIFRQKPRDFYTHRRAISYMMVPDIDFDSPLYPYTQDIPNICGLFELERVIKGPDSGRLPYLITDENETDWVQNNQFDNYFWANLDDPSLEIRSAVYNEHRRNAVNDALNSMPIPEDNMGDIAGFIGGSRYTPQTREELYDAIRTRDLADINTWNVSNITDMHELFMGLGTFNSNIEDWNVENVQTMKNMFDGCINFNQPLQRWNVKNVENMSEMFGSCTSFNQSLEGWNTENVEDMREMFGGCTLFNSSVSGWNVERVVYMAGMFGNCVNFNQPLTGWNTSSVRYMAYMFANCAVFNQAVEHLNVSNIESLESMFQGCRSFNQSLGRWNVSRVEDMSKLFLGCFTFNQPLGSWDVSNVRSMLKMFEDSTFFNQSLLDWNVRPDCEITDIFKNNVVQNPNNLPQRVRSQVINDRDRTREQYLRITQRLMQARQRMQQQQQQQQRIAYEVHDKFAKVDLTKLFEIVSIVNPTLAPDIPALVARLDGIIARTGLTDLTPLLQSIRHRIDVMPLNGERPTFGEIMGILDYVERQPSEYQANYIKSLVQDCVQAYDGHVDATSAAQNNTTASCPKGIQERFVFSLQNGGLGLPDNPEYQAIASILNLELTKPIVNHAISLCFQKPENAAQFQDESKSLEQKSAILTDCVLNWLRENKGFEGTVAPDIVQELVRDSQDMLMYGGKRKSVKKITRRRILRKRRTCKKRKRTRRK